MTGIYKITNTINNKIYIGQSVRIKDRWNEHCNPSPNKHSIISQAIKKYGKENFTFEVIEECSQDQLDEREVFWIKYYNSFEDGYNLTRGGSHGFYYDIEAIYQEYLKINNIAQTAKKIGCSANTVRKVLHSKGIFGSELQDYKPVECLNPKTLQVVKQFDSIQDAADFAKVSRNAIYMALCGKHKTSAGYYWREIGSNKEFQVAEKIESWKTKIAQLDYNDENIVLNTFDSAADAAAFLGKDRKNGGSYITSVCNGRAKSAFGYKWKKI